MDCRGGVRKRGACSPLGSYRGKEEPLLQHSRFLKGGGKGVMNLEG